MTIKERDEMLYDSTRWPLSSEGRDILRRIILALPVEAQPPQPKPSMSQAVRELVRAAEATVKRWDSPKWKLEEATAEYISELRHAIAAVKDLFVEESQ